MSRSKLNLYGRDCNIKWISDTNYCFTKGVWLTVHWSEGHMGLVHPNAIVHVGLGLETREEEQEISHVLVVYVRPSRNTR